MIQKAIVLAAGRGTRMGSLTEDLPKPMLPVQGRPMLEHVIRGLQSVGLREILLVVGYRRELVEEHFRGFDGVRFVTQEVVEGTGRAVQLGRDFVDDDSFLLTYGDILTPAANYRGICEMLAARDAAAAIGVRHVDDPWQGAAVYADAGGAISRIVEKPPKGASATNWNSAGLYVFAPVIFDEIATAPKSVRGEYEITTAIEQLISHGRRVQLFDMRGYWRDVGRPEDLAAVQGDSQFSA